jgi:CMP-N-acetylneuraminic acid synthetase
MSGYFALVPARGGSKGIPKKNLQVLDGHPLVAWAVAVAKESQLFEQIVVSSDDSEILQVSESYGASILIKRPANLAQDHSKQVPVILHAFETLERMKIEVNHVVLLQPTCPFRSPELLKRAIDLHKTFLDRSLISVSDISFFHDSSIYNGSLTDLDVILKLKDNAGTLRQEFSRRFWRNGSIYILNKADLILGNLYAKKIVGIEIPFYETINIDEYSERAKLMLNELSIRELRKKLFSS